MNRDFEAGVAGVFDERLERERPCEIYATETVEADIQSTGLRVRGEELEEAIFEEARGAKPEDAFRSQRECGVTPGGDDVELELTPHGEWRSRARGAGATRWELRFRGALR